MDIDMDTAAVTEIVADNVGRAFTRNDVRYAAVGGVVVGLAAGYFAAAHIVKKKYQRITDEEIATFKQGYRRLQKDAAFPDPATAVAALVPPSEIPPVEEKVDYRKIINEERYSREEPVEETRTVFDRSETEVEEVTVPDPDNPYIISEDEFMDDRDYDKVTLAYFEEDDTIIDDAETLVEADRTVGQANLERFGHRSNDPSIVFVRNERLKTDFEVTREDGSYAVTVLGMDPAILNENQRTRPSRGRKPRDE